MTLATLGLRFAITAVVIVAAGTLLARGGDVIAARTKLGGVWVGSVFLALATSLPEISTDIAAVRLGAPDLAAGDLFGSSMANMLILALVSLVPAGAEVFRRATLDHALYASLAIVMTCIAAATILVRPTGAVLGVGAGSLVLLVTYAVGSRIAFQHSTLAREAAATIEMSSAAPAAADEGPAVRVEPSLRRAVVTFLGAALVVLVAAPQFARSAEGIAQLTGIGSSFVGTWLVGLSTSLPELATSLAAVRLRAYDLAVGNLFGSNALNMAVFVLLDPLHAGGPVLGAVGPVHAVTALVAVALMGIAVATLVYRAKGTRALVEPGSVLIVLGYVVGLGLVFWRGAGR